MIANLPDAKNIAAVAVVLFAVLGYLSARAIPTVAAGNPELKVSFSPIRQMKTTLGIAHRDKVVLQAILGISWFWFLGASYLTQFPNFAKLYLAGRKLGFFLADVIFDWNRYWLTALRPPLLPPY